MIRPRITYKFSVPITVLRPLVRILFPPTRLLRECGGRNTHEFEMTTPDKKQGMKGAGKMLKSDRPEQEKRRVEERRGGRETRGSEGMQRGTESWASVHTCWVRHPARLGSTVFSCG